VPGLLLSDVPELQHFLFSSLIFFGLTARVTLDLAVHRQYIPENPARAVKHFNELRERPEKQMLTLDQETRIFAWVLFCSFKREGEPLPKDSGSVGTNWIFLNEW
jgi:hypothetical protein